MTTADLHVYLNGKEHTITVTLTIGVDAAPVLFIDTPDMEPSEVGFRVRLNDALATRWE